MMMQKGFLIGELVPTQRVSAVTLDNLLCETTHVRAHLQVAFTLGIQASLISLLCVYLVAGCGHICESTRIDMS